MSSEATPGERVHELVGMADQVERLADVVGEPERVRRRHHGPRRRRHRPPDVTDVVDGVGDRVLDDVEHSFERVVMFVGGVAADRRRRGIVGRVARSEEHLDQPDPVAESVVEAAVDVPARVVFGPGDDLHLPQRTGAVERNGELAGDVRPDRLDTSVVEDHPADVPVDGEVGVVLPHPDAVALHGDLRQDPVLADHAVHDQVDDGLVLRGARRNPSGR